MQTAESVVVFHTPRTRSSGVLFLLEELGVPYELELFKSQSDIRKPAHFDQIPPSSSVRVDVQKRRIEGQLTIFLYLADRFPQAGLAPEISAATRGDYLRWMTDYASSFEAAIADRLPQTYYRRHFEPAFIERFLKHDIAANRRPLDEALESLLDRISDQITRSPYLLGDTFSAADILWAPALYCTAVSGLIEPTAAIERYTRRVLSRQTCIDVMYQDVLLTERPASLPLRAVGS